MDRQLRTREGFSLIEVIVAVAILAILSVPILMYFTNSAVHTAQGRHEQSADIAAQSVVEEIGSIDGFESVEDKLVNIKDSTDSFVWQMINKAATVNGATEMSRKLSVDGDDYVVRMTIDYNSYTASGMAVEVADPHLPASPSSVTAKFNDYDNPHFQELYSESSIVVSEGDNTYDLGIAALFSKINSRSVSGGEITTPGEGGTTTDPDPGTPDTPTTDVVTMDTIKAGVKRSIVLRAKDDPMDSDRAVIQAAFRFEYGGESADVTVKNTRIEKNRLKNIYVLFNPLWKYTLPEDGTPPSSAEEDAFLDLTAITWGTVDGSFDGKKAEEKLSISFIKQKVPDSTGLDHSGNYTIHFKNPDGNGLSYGDNLIRFYGNAGILLPDAFNYDKGEGTFADAEGSIPSLMKTSKDKRIARLMIRVFDADTYDPDHPGDPLATLETSKSI